MIPEQIALAVMAVTLILGLIGIFRGMGKDRTQSAKEFGELRGTISTEVGNLKEGQREFRGDLEAVRTELQGMRADGRETYGLVKELSGHLHAPVAKIEAELQVIRWEVAELLRVRRGEEREGT